MDRDKTRDRKTEREVLDVVERASAISSSPASSTSAALKLFDISAFFSEYNPSFLFYGAATAGSGLVVFAPYNAHGVGVFDAETSAFDLVDISASIKFLEKKYFGAATAGNGLVVFAPYNAESVGIFDARSRQLTLVPILGAVAGEAKFCGAAAVGDLVVFAPHSAAGVGLFHAPLPPHIPSPRARQALGAAPIVSPHAPAAPGAFLPR